MSRPLEPSLRWPSGPCWGCSASSRATAGRSRTRWRRRRDRPRALVYAGACYRAITSSARRASSRSRGTAASDAGPARRRSPRRARKAAFRRWRDRGGRARSRPPFGADAQAALPRACGSRSGDSPARAGAPLTRPSVPSSGSRGGAPFDRHARAVAALRRARGTVLRRGAPRPAHRRALVYRPIGFVVSPHTELDGMPLQPIADELASRDRSLRAAPRLPRRPRGLLARLDPRAPPRELRLGHDGSDVSRRRTHGTFATRSPHRPNAIGLSLARIVGCARTAVVVDGIDLLSGRLSSI